MNRLSALLLISISLVLVSLKSNIAQTALSAASVEKSSQRPPNRLTEEDRAAIRALDSTFVNGWLNDDANAVLSVFVSDAVLFPPGMNPVRGLPAIRAYWWPQDGSRTKITAFDRHIDEIEGTDELAYLRGTATLSWTYEKDGQKSSQTSRSTDLLLLSRDAKGNWHVIRQMWNTLPN